MTSKILAIDAATFSCSVALLIDQQLIERYQLAPQQHAQLILPMIQSLLDEAGLSLKEIDAIAFGRGPGSFTGLRIAAAIVQALAEGVDLPVVVVSTLQGLAQAAYQQTGISQILVSLDARMHEVYWGVYQLATNGLMEALTPDSLCLPTEVWVPHSSQWLGVGDGWMSYATALETRCGKKLKNTLPSVTSHAKYIAQLAAVYFSEGKLVTAEEALPLYLRGAGTWKKLNNYSR